jgi:hypothetical protein
MEPKAQFAFPIPILFMGQTIFTGLCGIAPANKADGNFNHAPQIDRRIGASLKIDMVLTKIVVVWGYWISLTQ